MSKKFDDELFYEMPDFEKSWKEQLWDNIFIALGLKNSNILEDIDRAPILREIGDCILFFRDYANRALRVEELSVPTFSYNDWVYARKFGYGYQYHSRTTFAIPNGELTPISQSFVARSVGYWMISERHGKLDDKHVSRIWDAHTWYPDDMETIDLIYCVGHLAELVYMEYDKSGRTYRWNKVGRARTRGRKRANDLYSQFPHDALIHMLSDDLEFSIDYMKTVSPQGLVERITSIAKSRKELTSFYSDTP